MASTSSPAMIIRGFVRAMREALPEAAWQRCYVHFLRSALDRLPRKADDECMTELRWIYDRRTIEEARQDLAAWLKKWGKRYQKLCDWVEANITRARVPVIGLKEQAWSLKQLRACFPGFDLTELQRCCSVKAPDFCGDRDHTCGVCRSTPGKRSCAPSDPSN